QGARGRGGVQPPLGQGEAAAPSSEGAPKGPVELGVAGVRARAAALDRESCFDALGLPDGASAEAARAAFVRLAKTWHPDRLPAPLRPVHAEVAQICAHMARAQQTLCHRDARRGYIASRRPANARPREE